MNRQEQISRFFDEYAARFNKSLNMENASVEAVAEAFAECFIEASPQGIICGKNDDSFRHAIPQGYAFYRSIGITSMTIRTKETVILDEHHAMTKVSWTSGFQNKEGDAGSIEFRVLYLTQSRHGKEKIFAYITGDEQAALRANGLI